jgi:hypothetical protein
MKNLFTINEEEKNRILNLHENASKRHYLTEQVKKGLPGDPYEYKLENGVYSFRNVDKGETQWTTANSNQSSVIKTKIFKETPVLNQTKSKPLNSTTNNQTSKVYLSFDGTTLKWVVDGKVVKSWKAVSGRTKFNTFGDKNAEQMVKKYGGNNSEFMKIKEQGPIPVGSYTISQLQKRTNGDATQFMQGKNQKKLYDLMMAGNKHDWNSGEVADLIAWGDYRLPITKIGETETFGRGSFYIHGGGIPGSIGCIDLMEGMNDFANYFTEWKNKLGNKKLKLVVKY